MRLEPLQGWVIGRAAITTKSKSIILINPAAKITRFVLIELASPEAVEKGFTPGTFVVPKTMYDMPLNDGDGGTLYLVTFPITEIITRVHDLAADQLIGPDEKPFKMDLQTAAPAAA